MKPVATVEVSRSATRQTSRFSWEAVDPRDIRTLLVAVYRERGLDQEVRRVRKLSESGLRVNALEVLGSPPKSAAFTPDVCRALLGSSWLVRAEPWVVDELVTIVRLTLGRRGRSESTATKREQIGFLRRRTMDATLRLNVRKSFIKAHKVLESVPADGTPPDGEAHSAAWLLGKGEHSSRPPYAHQTEARGRLRHLSAGGSFRGRLVFPTGGGKTDTIVEWLLDEMEADPSVRVLWLAHQQELVDQAWARLLVLSAHRAPSFRRRIRRVHSGAGRISTLADPELDVAVVTYQSLRGLEANKKSLLGKYFERPVIVVVDEAHHVGSPTYDSLLTEVDGPNLRALVGLTATPYPTAPGARARFRARFPELILEVKALALIDQGVLARPTVTTVDTGEVFALTDQQVAAAVKNDMPAEVLAWLDRENRNRLVVNTWIANPGKWKKTLVFAASIHHANRLADLFRRAGAESHELHSRVKDRKIPLDAFRKSSGPIVLVSVGMLTEGVDLPDATTAFVARPTTSAILMRQMVGRVLRGPEAGGEAHAHVVHFRDEWENLPDVLGPEEVLPGAVIAAEPEKGRGWTPQPIVDDEGLRLRDDLTAQIRRAHQQVAALINHDDDDEFNDHPLDPILRTCTLVGFYELDEHPFPVFDHQLEAFESLLQDVLSGDEFRGRGFLGRFEDGPPPYPTPRSLQQLVEITREYGEAPELTRITVTVGPERVADEIQQSGALTDDERADLVRRYFESHAEQLLYPSLDAYEEAVERALRDRRRQARRLHPENPIPQPTGRSDLKPLPRSERDLQPVVRTTVGASREILPPQYTERLHGLPGVGWTRRVVESSFGHWSVKLTGKGRGNFQIRINRLLRTTERHVSDEMLSYLVYHELLHHLLPGHGHDAEFRHLESLWPNAVDLDYQFDTLHERYDIRKERYPRDVE